MAILSKRSEFTDNAQAKASSGWQSCMSKPMCKYVPVFHPFSPPPISTLSHAHPVSPPHATPPPKADPPPSRWPAILGILLAIILLLTLTYFFLRCLSCCCCDCLSGGRYRRAGGKRKQYKYADLHSSPYHANPAYRSGGNDAPPPPGYAVGQPPQGKRG
ncbi:MAG: hypothetical protein L6R40_001449 [Gallowayella cf. fulva]|nr:MAG: hypothetical protein L6R40_001449 [Xanthomendoza cf. fulva]